MVIHLMYQKNIDIVVDDNHKVTMIDLINFYISIKDIRKENKVKYTVKRLGLNNKIYLQLIVVLLYLKFVLLHG